MVVIDTQALVMWLSGQGTLSSAMRERIERERHAGALAISVISVLEVSQYVDGGRLKLSVDKRRWLSTLVSIDGLRVIPVDMAITIRAANFPIEIDMSLRLIAATAITVDAVLITPDKRLHTLVYGESVW
ncbi:MULTISPECIES: type II toxin-antitoxin system VapC family toxin [Burkholderia cepacia complex]|uniref:type II toxin-antitoxin system VapC family toxin n=1 Tax=Burkholderia cepacia complex TaxID=87882 RepID=UPI00075A4A0E|nr:MULTISPECIES: type II toxin-antitoxin system VapC family toxin [Burkholderia cepacia complex]KUZ34865.1 hypothetical protein WS52_17740 [Burkholderia territorii]KUZ59676.1 hypothetical protein WS53_07235 [Burkholderia territorii]KVC15908.1 hypothetical protein WI69_20445 [Burkholderia diffusa]